MKSVISLTIGRGNQYVFSQKSLNGEDKTGEGQSVRTTVCSGDSSMKRLTFTFRSTRGESELQEKRFLFNFSLSTC